jgi:membrane dipeptidase
MIIFFKKPLGTGAILCLLSLCFILPSLAQAQSKKTVSDEQIRQKADKLAHQNIIIDGHVDLPYRLRIKNFRLTKEYVGIPVSSKEGDFDYVRAKKGGLSAPFMSIYIPSEYQLKPGYSKQLADSLIDMVQGIAKSHPDKFALANSPEDIERNFKKGLISLPMGMENGSPVENDIKNVQYFYNRGIRYITLTHGKDNQICDSSYDTTHTWHGLSDFGKDVVKEMNRVGIMVDVSHISDDTFWQVVELSKAPCIASHSSCRYFTPGFERNMSDEMIKKLGEKGGVIQINFATGFLNGEKRDQMEAKKKELSKLLKEKDIKSDSEAGKTFIEKFQKENTVLLSDVEEVANHIDHVVKLAGIDHVGLGSDYDGVGDTLPTGLKDVSQYPNLIAVLLKRGYSDEDIAKICYKNVFRVWQKVQEVAKGS